MRSRRPDSVSRDFRQHLELARARATATNANVELSIHNAEVDWFRSRAAEKKRERRTRYLDDLLEEPAAPDPFEPLANSEAIAVALHRLEPRNRAAVILRFLHGEPLGTIATMLGTTYRSAKHAVEVALREMR